MKTVPELLSYIRQLGIDLWVDGNSLRYSAPKEVMTPILSAQLAERKNEIITFLNGFKSAYTSTLLPLQPIARDGKIPLSSAQQRLWFLEQLEGDSVPYNELGALSIDGRLNIVALEVTLNEIVRRHEVLRTNFPSVNGSPVCKIFPFLKIDLPIIDLQTFSEVEQFTKVQQLAAELVQHPFDLANDPLLRFRLLRLGERSHVLILVMHHIVFDGRSINVFFNELAVLYEAFRNNQISPLPDLPVQYADFAAWQHQWLTGKFLEKQLNYWKQKLANAPALLKLPTDQPRPAVQTFRGAHHNFALPKKLSEALVALSKRKEVTLFTTLITAFQILLYRYSGQEDILVGTPIANLDITDIEGLIGFFANTIVVRTKITNKISFERLLEQVQETLLEAQAHRDAPLEHIIEALQPQRSLSYTPLFQVLFIFQDTPITEINLKDLTFRPLAVESGISKFDISILLNNTAQGLTGWWEYNADLFNVTTIERMANNFETLLESIVTDSHQLVTHLPLLNEAEQHWLLVEQNRNHVSLLQEKYIHQKFEETVKRSPENIAVIFQEQQLTYQELNKRANQLAHYLQKLGVGADVLVGICIERSVEMVIGLLAILKAGGAYVPLDPAYPKNRLAFMISYSQLSVLLTQQKLVAELPENKAHLVCLDTNWETISLETEENPCSNLMPENLAYVIYTSGSTGQPKGVMVEHGQVVNFFTGMDFRIGSDSPGTWLAVTTISFDISVLELLWTLTRGFQVVVYTVYNSFFSSIEPQAEEASKEDVDSVISSLHRVDQVKELNDIRKEIEKHDYSLPAQIIRHNVTHLQCTPSLVRMLILNSETLKPLRSLQKLILGGEALSAELANKLNEVVSGEVLNMYGPTEATIWSTTYTVGSSKKIVAIGKPIANVRVYVLDQHYQPVPIGIPGELFIGGAGVARGYLNRSELTTERFIPDTFSNDPKARMYKTGDLVRYLPDGNIEFLGRIDQQIKIRGFRIELGEIEVTLKQHPTVQDAAVLARENSFGDKQLVGYFVPKALSDGLDESNRKELLDQQILQWYSLWNQTYDSAAANQDAKLKFAGWHSSYTGQPISVQEMDEWVDFTVKRILSLKPNRVLEIGCGYGLLLLRIAPYCAEYWGTDFSEVAINYIQQQLVMQSPSLSQVKLFQRGADNFEGLETEAFDTVILNSVVQYFPSIDYLLQVLENAVKVVKPGGFIVVGDVRSLPLLQAFHISVELYKASDSLSTSHLLSCVQKSMDQEQELVIDPAFFIALQENLTKITHVQIEPKKGHYSNELSKFRYDVILHVGGEKVNSTQDFLWLDWHNQDLTLTSVSEIIESTQPDILGLRRVTNLRLQTEVKALELLASNQVPKTVGDFRSMLEKIVGEAQESGVLPEDLWNLGSRLSYSVEISWSNNYENGSYDVLFKRLTSDEKCRDMSSYLLGKKHQLKPWRTYANNPLRKQETSHFISQLRDFLKKQLPEYMVPGVFVMLEALPLTSNGKVDRRALPLPTREINERDSLLLPRNPTEKVVVSIIAEVLGLEHLSIYDNFFELGGHSLLAIQVISRLRETFKVELPVRSLFEKPVIAAIAKAIDTALETGISPMTTNTLDLNAEAVLDSTIQPQSVSVDHVVSEPQSILLTGATGFLGAYLLHELLEETQANIYCLVRSPNILEGKWRIQSKLESYFLWNESFRSRIIPVVGDLSTAFLGLSEPQFRHLASLIDVIYHNGALVNFVYPYSVLKEANVLGTQEILRLASEIRVKPVHFVSTIAVASPFIYSESKVVRESDPFFYSRDIDTGYAQSKWVAEKLVIQARDRGLPVSIYRAARIAGHSKTGVCNTDDLICRMIKGCIQLGKMPKLDGIVDNITPVDYVNQAIVHLSRQKKSLGKDFHVINSYPTPVNDIFNWIGSLGYQLEEVSYDQWRSELILHEERSLKNALHPLLPLFSQNMLKQKVALQFDCHNTIDGLAGTNIVCPSINKKLFTTYFSYLISSGFLKALQQS
ncbi:MAG: thioester reductase domain-containing protein [Pelatocladus maniniholoensis HA4357-MV3]|jgi:thioester reductase-like protein|uniref:Thioester reductase domain-containing protein n=1 Tax=Pelatocladus maniniholoensis HA4357-MV3 TaxID=1117104 RepID=A0A9E3LV24_9NOST|nr:thioester reductase domain-containing protein [Pelatocladus maniniholoensis HA4357-MV3]